MQKTKPFLWFEKDAPQAVKLYTSLIPNSHIDNVEDIDFDSPEGAMSIAVISFSLGGVEYLALNAPGAPKSNESFSTTIYCDDQAEVDRIWDALIEGGEPMQCGWLRDRFGFCWQIVPRRFNELVSSGTPAQRNAVMQAMMQMVKFNVADLESAFAANA